VDACEKRGVTVPVHRAANVSGPMDGSGLPEPKLKFTVGSITRNVAPLSPDAAVSVKLGLVAPEMFVVPRCHW
jgi:hypothetical protein